jgi:hypothetical protein
VARSLEAQLGSVGAVAPQQVAGAHVGEGEFVAQARGLGPLPGSRRAEQDKVQVGHGSKNSLITREVSSTLVRMK